MGSNEEKDDELNIVFIGIIILFVGILGFYYLEKLSLVTAFYEAASVLSTVGASVGPKTQLGKLFSGVYALVSLIFLIVTSARIGNWLLKN